MPGVLRNAGHQNLGSLLKCVGSIVRINSLILYQKMNFPKTRLGITLFSIIIINRSYKKTIFFQEKGVVLRLESPLGGLEDKV
jgi:hypothetical protein